MDNSPNFKEYASFVNFCPDRYGKSTLFENDHILVGLNCLEAGQCMEKHIHEVQNRFYLVLEGKGIIRVGEEKREAGPGMVVWIPAGLSHRIENDGDGRMVLLVGIAPAHAH
jgi:quercetin dioxygenase-like cupin family protein